MFDSKILGYDILFLKPKFQFEIICTEKKVDMEKHICEDKKHPIHAQKS